MWEENHASTDPSLDLATRSLYPRLPSGLAQYNTIQCCTGPGPSRGAETIGVETQRKGND